MVARVGDEAGYRRWSGQVERAGFCVQPVRLAGGSMVVDTVTGEVGARYSSEGEPGGVLLVACKDRRESVCPPCAARYRADAWHVFAAGLAGRGADEGGHEHADAHTGDAEDSEDTGKRADAGKGVGGGGADDPDLTPEGSGWAVPASVAGHPAVLATFTAPSFGRVHAYRDGGVCRVAGSSHGGSRGGRGGKRCPHGRPLWCGARHGPDDSAVGAPLCAECADLPGMVLWNASVGELWRRTVIYVYRALAELAPAVGGRPVGVRGVRDLLRVPYAKVAEFQKRGVVHVHVIARLDGVDAGDRERIVAPPAWAGVELLEAALRRAASRVRVEVPVIDGRQTAAVWGGQLDVRPIGGRLGDGGHEAGREAAARIAGYLAKYATKSIGVGVGVGVGAVQGAGVSGRRGAARGVPSHLAALADTVRMLGRRGSCRGLRLGAHVDTLGFRGHVTSKSRRYSVTFAALRAARRAWRAAQHVRPDDPWADDGDGGMMLVGQWRMTGLGFKTFGDGVLAEVLGREHRAAREAARCGLTW